MYSCVPDPMIRRSDAARLMQMYCLCRWKHRLHLRVVRSTAKSIHKPRLSPGLAFAAHTFRCRFKTGIPGVRASCPRLSDDPQPLHFAQVAGAADELIDAGGERPGVQTKGAGTRGMQRRCLGESDLPTAHVGERKPHVGGCGKSEAQVDRARCGIRPDGMEDGMRWRRGQLDGGLR